MNQKMSEIVKLFQIPNNPVLYQVKYPTGFVELDNALGGGLTAGLHCIGAIPSLGKSTFVMQMAENLSSRNIPSLIFSLEMKAVDLTAKAISRQTYLDTTGRPYLAKTMNELLSEQSIKNFTKEEQAVIYHATQALIEKSSHITISESRTDIYFIDKMETTIREYINTQDRKPVVILDYLQILDAPERLRNATDKQIADYNLKQLKRIADIYDIPVILISSFNRENYEVEVTFRAFKDSGNIEYSCDTVMGLQLQGVGTKEFDVEIAKTKYPREIELKILKQRYGAVGIKIPYHFYTKYNYFKENILMHGKEAPFSLEDEKKRKKF